MPFKCDKCSYETNRRFNFDRHTAKSHDVGSPSFTCSLCGSREMWRANLIKHFQDVHNVELTTTTLRFESMEQFSLWKIHFEKETASRFIKLKGDQSKIVYRCHREGVFKPRGVGKRRMRLLGSNKINSCCPAEIKVVLDDNGSVTATVINTHVGHSKELSRIKLPLKNTTNVFLANQSEITPALGTNEWENSLNEKLKRFHLLTRNDLINITQSYRLGNAVTHNERDYTSMEAWLKKKPDMVRFFKAEGTFLISHPELECDDFLLVVANDSQIHLLKNYGSTFLCVDTVHGRSKNDFHLTSLMALDDLGQCFPCALMLSNKVDATSTMLFLSVIRNTLGCDLATSVLMSDMSPIFRTAWVSMMPEPTHELFSTWHIEKLWKASLRKVAGNLKQKEAFKVLRNLLREKDQTTFSQSLVSTLSELEIDPSTTSFARHFRAEYLDNVQSWAHCHRSHCGVNPLFLEAMHKTINHIYFEGRKVQKQDRCIYVLMKFIRDKLYDRLTMNREENLNKVIADIHQHHRNALLMPEVQLQDMKEGWSLSLGSNSVPFEVVRNNLNCNCHVKCDNCDICIHAFHCSCLDSAMNWTICSHIHFLVMKNIASKPPLHQLTTNQDVPVLEEIQVIIPTSKKEEVYESCVIESVIHDEEDFDEVFDDNCDTDEVKIDDTTIQDNHQEFEEIKQQTLNIFQNVMDSARTIEDHQIIQSVLIPLLNQEYEANQTKTNIEVIHVLESRH